jgi:hypothetical protein
MRLAETLIINSPVISVCRRLVHQWNQQRSNQKTDHDEVKSIGKCLCSRLPQRQSGKIL